MLRALVRLTSVSRLLGVDVRTCEGWLHSQGWQATRAPKLGNSQRNSPRYVSMEAATALAAALLPGKVNRLALQRSRAWLTAQARALEDSTRNLQHAVGGTGVETPTPKQAL